MEIYLRKSAFLHRVLILVDIQVGLMDSDKMLIEMLTESQKPFIIIHTKADKVKDEAIKEQMQKTADYIKKSGSLCSPFLHAISSYNGYGMHELLANFAYVLNMPILRKPL